MEGDASDRAGPPAAKRAAMWLLMLMQFILRGGKRQGAESSSGAGRRRSRREFGMPPFAASSSWTSRWARDGGVNDPYVGLVMVRFRDDALERDWWEAVQSRSQFRMWEQASLGASLICAIASETWKQQRLLQLDNSNNNNDEDDGSVVDGTELIESLTAAFQIIAFAALFVTSTFFKAVHRRHHDAMVAAVRIGLYPALLLSGRCPSASLGRSMALELRQFLSFFGHFRCAVDAARLPLRFRHHLLVQATVVALSCMWNWATCERCFSAAAGTIFATCRWLAFASTGVLARCEAAGFRAACLTASAEAGVLIGLVATSTVVYRIEMRSREAFLAGRRADGPARDRDRDR